MTRFDRDLPERRPPLTLRPTPQPVASEACASLQAAHDLAALAAGSLSPNSMRRLARHVAHCDACKLVLASVVSDAQAVESSGLLPVTSRAEAAPMGSAPPATPGIAVSRSR